MKDAAIGIGEVVKALAERGCIVADSADIRSTTFAAMKGGRITRAAFLPADPLSNLLTPAPLSMRQPMRAPIR